MGVLEGYTQLADTIMKGFSNLARTKERGAETMVDTERLKAGERLRQQREEERISSPQYQEQKWLSEPVGVNLGDFFPKNQTLAEKMHQVQLLDKILPLYTKSGTVDSGNPNLPIVKQDGTPYRIPRWLNEKLKVQSADIIMANMNMQDLYETRLDKIDYAIRNETDPDVLAKLNTERANIQKSLKDPISMQMANEDLLDRINSRIGLYTQMGANPNFIKMLEGEAKRVQADIDSYEPIQWISSGNERFWKSHGEKTWHRLPNRRERGDVPSAEDAIKNVISITKDVKSAKMALSRLIGGASLNDLVVQKFFDVSGKNPATIEQAKEDINDYVNERQAQGKYFYKHVPKEFPVPEWAKEDSERPAPSPPPPSKEESAPANDPLLIR